MTSRLAPEREQTLSGLHHYHRQFFEPEASERDAEAMADAEFARISRLFGTEIVDLAADETE